MTLALGQHFFYSFHHVTTLAPIHWPCANTCFIQQISGCCLRAVVSLVYFLCYHFTAPFEKHVIKDMRVEVPKDGNKMLENLAELTGESKEGK